jgi:hypothetical protein
MNPADLINHYYCNNEFYTTAQRFFKELAGDALPPIEYYFPEPNTSIFDVEDVQPGEEIIDTGMGWTSSEQAKLVGIIDNDRIPSWAKFLARDSDGAWYWYSKAPAVENEIGAWVVGYPIRESLFEQAGEESKTTWMFNWRESLITIDEYHQLLEAHGKPVATNNDPFEHAPESAKYYAMDDDGYCFWYDNKPEWDGHEWDDPTSPKMFSHMLTESKADCKKLAPLSLIVRHANQAQTDPNFIGAPDWVKWKATDDDGREFWYSVKPRLVEGQGCWALDDTAPESLTFKCELIDRSIGWKESLVERK